MIIDLFPHNPHRIKIDGFCVEYNGYGVAFFDSEFEYEVEPPPQSNPVWAKVERWVRGLQCTS